jgi:hypothetical protein
LAIIRQITGKSLTRTKKRVTPKATGSTIKAAQGLKQLLEKDQEEDRGHEGRVSAWVYQA